VSGTAIPEPSRQRQPAVLAERRLSGADEFELWSRHDHDLRGRARVKVSGLGVAAIPAAFSFLLALSTAGSHVYWQDSGYYLVAVKELGVLYPPGFVLYVLLCKLWTLALSFVDFTYAVHLFSALCGALAAGTIALAVRDLLRTRGPVFHTAGDDGPLPGVVGAAVGCLAASGYTFWASAILAKGYALYFLLLGLLIWWMIRADASRTGRDFTIVAVLIGLAWQAHPSATNVGLALLLFVFVHHRALGWKGVAWRTALAAACAIGPILLLPWMARGGSVLRFGDVGTPSGFWEYLTGHRYTGVSGGFGLAESRVAGASRFFWEEFLGVGLAAVLLGFVRTATVNRRLLIGIAAWVVPVVAVSVLAKVEGQYDFWLVAAWIPLWFVAGVGLHALRPPAVVVALALIGSTWAIAANHASLDQREYTFAETLGHLYLDTVDPGATVMLVSDDTQSTALYLQRIKGIRRDVRLVGGPLHEEPGVVQPPTFVETTSVTGDFPPGAFLLPAGALFKVTRPNENRIDLEYWREPIQAEDVAAGFRRARGQFADISDGRLLAVRPEPFEMRLLRILLLGRKNLADVLVRYGGPDALGRASRLYESILELLPAAREDPIVVVSLAVAYARLKQYDRAENTFRKALDLDLPAATRLDAYASLERMSIEQGHADAAAEWRSKALADPRLDESARKALGSR